MITGDQGAEGTDISDSSTTALVSDSEEQFMTADNKAPLNTGQVRVDTCVCVRFLFIVVSTLQISSVTDFDQAELTPPGLNASQVIGVEI